MKLHIISTAIPALMLVVERDKCTHGFRQASHMKADSMVHKVHLTSGHDPPVCVSLGEETWRVKCCDPSLGERVFLEQIGAEANHRILP